MITRRGPAVAVCAVGLAMMAVITGCTGAGPGPDPAPTSAASMAVPNPTGAQIPQQSAGVVGATAVPTDVPNDSAIRRATTVTACAAMAGGWSAGGKVTNPGQAKREVTITIFFATDSGTVLAVGQTKVGVDGGASQDWTVSSSFTAPEHTMCVLRGVG